MNQRWIDLAATYEEGLRRDWEAFLAHLSQGGKMSEERVRFHRSSRASFLQYLARFLGSGAPPADIERFRALSEDDVATFKVLSTDLVRMHFLKAMAYDAGVAPPELAVELVRGAVYTVDPSFNRQWIEELARTEPRRTAAALATFMRTGTAFEVGGAANASYWFGCFAPGPIVKEFFAECVPIFLRRFVDTDDLDLRRCLMRFSWDPAPYDAASRALLERAAAIAADNPDDYIRQRYQHDTGQSELIPCLPHRSLWKELGENEPPAP